MPVLTFSLSPSIQQALPQPNNGLICSGQTSTLTVSGASTYTWSTGLLQPSIAISPTLQTTYTVSGTNSQSCTSTQTFVVNTTNGQMSISGPMYLCYGYSATLHVPPTFIYYNYIWSTGSNQSTTAVTPTANASYSVTNQCGYTASFNITVVPGLTLTLTSSQPTICAGTSCTLTAAGANTYTWNTGAHSPSIAITPGNTTTYTLAGTGGPTGGCSATATFIQFADICTSMENNNPDLPISTFIYPNPASTYLFIESGEILHRLSVRDISGRTIIEKEIIVACASARLDVANLQPGIYFIEINEGRKTVRFIKN